MTTHSFERIQVVDSHTGGEPTRVVIAGCPSLGEGTVAQRLTVLKTQHDRIRSAIVNEPRGSDVLVGAMLLKPSDPANTAGVIFFNNVGYLGMCGHGMMGLVATLAHLGRIQPGEHRIETPVGLVTVTLNDDESVSVTNVPSYRHSKSAAIEVPGIGKVSGDVAWGGNWFYLVKDLNGQMEPLELSQIESLTNLAWRTRQALNRQGHPEVDHVEFFGPPRVPGSDSRNFVLCPGNAYDRSPCGTGTSAKLACLAADEHLQEGQRWVQESILGSTFVGSYRWLDRKAGQIIPTITGTAYVTGESTLLFDKDDPFRWGIRRSPVTTSP